MSAEILREAASKMRERAEAATPGPWHVDGYFDIRSPGNWLDASFILGEDANPEPGDVKHIASWHPAVALAVADWLDSVAADLDERQRAIDGYLPATPPGTVRVDVESCQPNALTVARAYLGSDR